MLLLLSLTHVAVVAVHGDVALLLLQLSVSFLMLLLKVIGMGGCGGCQWGGCVACVGAWLLLVGVCG